MSLFTHYPWWYLLACPLAGLLYAWLLYVRTADFPLSWKRGLFFLRFLTVTLIFLLVFDPLLHFIKTIQQHPYLVVLSDNSASMVSGADSSQVRQGVIKINNLMGNSLGKDYTVVHWQFDSDASLLKDIDMADFKGTQTAIGDALSKIGQRYLPGELAGVVLISDGINNYGKDPLGVARSFPVPIFTIATGDTSSQLDLALRQIFYNRQTFAGNNFPLEINLKATGASGKKSQIDVLFEDRVVWSQDFTVGNSNQSFTFTPLINAPREGLLKYTIRVKGLPGEINVKNNISNFYVDAQKKPTQILILSEGPHPDVGALRDIFEEGNMFNARWLPIGEWNAATNADIDLVIFCNLPTAKSDIGTLVESFRKQQRPMLFILGSNTDASRFNKLNTGISIKSLTGKASSFYPVFNSGFGLFKINNLFQEKVGILPPLTGPEGVYEAQPGTEVLFYQKISGVETPYPLVAYTRIAGQSQGIICGEGIWWWRNISYKELGTHQEFRELLTSIILYLAGGADKGNFRVRAPQRLKQGEHAYFVAELFNPSYESVNEPDVSLRLTDSRGNEFPFLFSRRETGYGLDAGVLDPGVWKWVASTQYAGRNYSDEGMFVVEENLAEVNNLQADHLLLKSLSDVTGGTMVYLTEIDNLPKLIKQIAPPAVHVTEEESFNSIFDLWPLMLVIFLLAATEWGIRKYNGIL